MMMRSTLSLFNGVGVGIQALKNLNVGVGKSYVCEVDKFANMTNEKNHPESIQLGDVTLWREWDIDWTQVDLVTAGFPCQSWSMAGQQLGDKDPRGDLFWTTLDIISNVLLHNPNTKWLMENVKMKREFEEYITKHTIDALGHVEKILINSALVTAQNRNRWYWSNFTIEQPEDRGIVLSDIVGNTVKCGALRGRYVKDGVRQDHKGSVAGKTTQRLEIRDDEKSNTLKTVQKDNVLVKVGTASDIKGNDSMKRIYSTSGKCPTLTTMGGGHRQPKIALDDLYYRKLTPLECERLQGFPDDYTEGVSNTQRYKQCGNAWTLPVIEHIFRGL